MSKYEKAPVDFSTIEPTREFVDENGQHIVRIIDENDLKEPMDLTIPKKRKGFISLEEDNPTFLSEFDYELNFPLKPKDISKCSNTKYWWTIFVIERDILFVISWKSHPNNRQIGRKCPYLNNYKIHELFNSLLALKPHIAAQVHPTKNGNLSAKNIGLNYSKKIWWYQKYYSEEMNEEFEFEWQTYVYLRVKADGLDNPFLAGKLIHPKFNSLQARYKEIAEEWSWEDNGLLKPSMVSYGSGKKVYFKCKKCGYVYPSTIADRVRGHGCTECQKSQFQKFVESILKINNINFETEINLYKKYRFDIYSRELNLLIDPDGNQHFRRVGCSDTQFEYRVKCDNDKNIYAYENKILFLRVPYIELNIGSNSKRIERWILDFIDTRQIPEEIIEIYEKKNPLSNYPSIAREMNTWVTKQKETVAS